MAIPRRSQCPLDLQFDSVDNTIYMLVRSRRWTKVTPAGLIMISARRHRIREGIDHG